MAQFNISAPVLLDACKEVSQVVTSSTVLPVLRCLLFELQDGKLAIKGNNLESAMEVVVPVDSQDTGKAAIPAKMLLDFLRTAGDVPLTVTIDEEKFRMVIDTPSGHYEFAGDNPVEFPQLPEAHATQRVDIPASLIRHLIDTTLFAASKDEDTQRHMAGIRVELSPERLRFVTTDARRLVLYDVKTITFPSEVAFTIPRKAAAVLKGILPDRDDPVTMAFDDRYAHFTFENTTFITQLVESAFPDYKAILPESYPNALTGERDHLLNALKRVALFANKTTQTVIFQLSATPRLIAEDVDFANRAEEALSATYEGQEMQIGFNAPMLEEMYRHFPADVVRMEFLQPTVAAMLYPQEQKPEERILMLIMPMEI